MVSHLPSENQIRLSKICAEHDVNQLLELIKNNKNLKDVSIHGSFYTACANESIRKNEFIDIFLHNEKLKKHINFSNICANMISVNNFEIFKKLSSYIPINDYLSKYLNQIIENANIEFLKQLLSQYQIDALILHKSFVKACECGQLEMIKYLFANYNLNIHFDNDLAIRRAGSNNHINIVKYLLEDPSLKEKANPLAMNDDLSISAIMQNNEALIHYLYNQYGLKESQTVMDYKKYKQDLAIQHS